MPRQLLEILEEQGHFLDDYIFAMGTGTSYTFLMEQSTACGGVGTGGGMIQGLGYLLTGIKD